MVKGWSAANMGERSRCTPEGVNGARRMRASMERRRRATVSWILDQVKELGRKEGAASKAFRRRRSNEVQYSFERERNATVGQSCLPAMVMWEVFRGRLYNA